MNAFKSNTSRTNQQAMEERNKNNKDDIILGDVKNMKPFPRAYWISRETRRLFIVIIYAWLFMNVDPIYSRRTVASMVASKLINRSFANMFNSQTGSRNTGNNGLSTAEAIALILAINNNKGPPETSLQHLSTRQQLETILSPNNRQLPVPIPTPVPVPTPAPVPIVVLLTAIVAFLSAVASGLSPIFAVFAAIFVSIIAVLVAILAVIIKLPTKGSGKGQKALIKKLIIKKTVLPFVIPIPYKQKEKEVVYKYMPKPIIIHHKEKQHKDHKEYKSDNIPGEQDETLEPLKKLEDLVTEQDHLQSLVDRAVKGRIKGKDSSPDMEDE